LVVYAEIKLKKIFCNFVTIEGRERFNINIVNLLGLYLINLHSCITKFILFSKNNQCQSTKLLKPDFSVDGPGDYLLIVNQLYR